MLCEKITTGTRYASVWLLCLSQLLHFGRELLQEHQKSNHKGLTHWHDSFAGEADEWSNQSTRRQWTTHQPLTYLTRNLEARDQPIDQALMTQLQPISLLTFLL